MKFHDPDTTFEQVSRAFDASGSVASSSEAEGNETGSKSADLVFIEQVARFLEADRVKAPQLLNQVMARIAAERCKQEWRIARKIAAGTALILAGALVFSANLNPLLWLLNSAVWAIRLGLLGVSRFEEFFVHYLHFSESLCPAFLTLRRQALEHLWPLILTAPLVALGWGAFTLRLQTGKSFRLR